MKRWTVDVHLRGDAKCTHPRRIRVWFDPSEDDGKHSRSVREGLTAVERVLSEGGVLYLPTSSHSTYWVHSERIAGIEISSPEGEEL